MEATCPAILLYRKELQFLSVHKSCVRRKHKTLHPNPEHQLEYEGQIVLRPPKQEHYVREQSQLFPLQD